MRGYSETSVFSAQDLRLLQRTEEIVARFPESGPEGPLRCHEVARAVGRILGLEVQDGQYGFADHSWLWTSPMSTARIIGRTGFPNILDPYCVGSLPVVRLVHCSSPGLPHVGWSYRPGPARDDVDVDLVELLVRGDTHR